MRNATEVSGLPFRGQMSSYGSAPGGWPFMTATNPDIGLGAQTFGCSGTGGAMPNAATLAQSLYAGWQQGPATMPLQLQALPMERGVSWGAELLPFITEEAASSLMDPSALDSPTRAEPPLMSAGMDIIASGGSGGEDGCGSRSMHKQRFVWTGELHRRFEAAVNTLGIDAAKPQAISQLMNCEGEGAPTRQNIKSHLQKYRLLMQKRSRQGGGSGGASSSITDNPRDASPLGCFGTVDSERRTDVQTELEQHIANQEMNLKRQMELQTKLHRHMLVQRQLQHQLEHCFLAPGQTECVDRQRYQATLSLKNSLRERLTKHVMLQQEMLQHLDALVGNEAGKPKAVGGLDNSHSLSEESRPQALVVGAAERE